MVSTPMLPSFPLLHRTDARSHHPTKIITQSAKVET
jgi:hypothetical protein